MNGNATIAALPQVDEFEIDVCGARMHGLRAGSGRPLLLIHGLAGSSANWLSNIGALAQDASVYAIDQINTGKSQRVAGLDASLPATADRVAAAMTVLGLDSADIVGASHGGAVALTLAGRYPDRVRSLILFAPANPFSHVGDFLVRFYTAHWGRFTVRMGPYLPRRMQLWALARMYGDPSRIAQGCLERYTVGLRTPGTMQHLLAIVDSWFADMARLETLLPRVADVPTLLVWGDRDTAVDPASATPLHQILCQSELHIVPTGGHVVFEELPEESNRIMLDWLRRHPAPTPPAVAGV